MGWLLLLPLAFAFWLTVTAANACVKKGGLWRLLGVLVSFVIGGICIQVGYWFGIEGFTEWQANTYPVLGWIMIISGGLIAVLGTWTVLVRMKEIIERQEEMEKLEKEMKRVGEETLKQDEEKEKDKGSQTKTIRG